MVPRRQLIRRAARARRRSWLCLFLLALLISKGSAELSLTPRQEEYELEGVKMWRLSFETGTSTPARYRPPDGWEYSGSAKHLNLRPPGLPHSEGNITRFDAPEFPPCNEEGAKKLEKMALSSLPEGAEEAKIASETASPMQICGKETFLLEISFTSYGERLGRYCLYLVTDEGPMRFQFTCRQADYDQLSKAFQKSLYTWQHL